MVEGKLFALVNIERMKEAEDSTEDLTLVAFCADIAGLVLRQVDRVAAAETGAAEERAARLEHQKETEALKGSLARIVSPAAAVQIVQSQPEFPAGIARQEATILFTNVRGFGELAGKMDPVDLARQVNEMLEARTGVLFIWDGVLDKYLGDGIMALFGASVAQPEDPVRAVACGLEMLEALQKLNFTWEQRGKPLLRVGIGIATGEVAVGYLGTPQQMSYSALGDPVNLAVRLTALAEPMQLPIGATTLTRAAGFFETRPVGPWPAHGKAGPIGAAVISGRKPGVDLRPEGPFPPARPAHIIQNRLRLRATSEVAWASSTSRGM